MFYHNVLQIVENSEGEEGAFNGDSDFRHAAVSSDLIHTIGLIDDRYHLYDIRILQYSI